jgi:hypothetical protein
MADTATNEEADHIPPGDQVEEIDGDTAEQQVDQDVVDHDNPEPVHRTMSPPSTSAFWSAQLVLCICP